MSTQPNEAKEELQRRMAALYGQQVRRGERQLVVVKGMMDRRTAGAELDGALEAARMTAAFIGREGWIRGPVWVGYGTQWLLARWSLERGLSSADIAAHMETITTQRSDPKVEDTREETNESKRGVGSRRKRAAAFRKGFEQAQALDVLFNHLLKGSQEVEQAKNAATLTARFATAEGWAVGSLWIAYGMQLIVARWALDQGIPSDEIEAVLSGDDKREADQIK